MDPGTAPGVWGCPCLNVRLGGQRLGEGPASFPHQIQLASPAALTAALPLYTQCTTQEQRAVVSCRVCAHEVYAFEGEACIPPEGLHAPLPRPENGTLLVAATCLPASAFAQAMRAPAYVPTLGLVLPEYALNGSDMLLAVLASVHSAGAAPELPDVPAHLVDTPSCSHAPRSALDQKALDKLANLRMHAQRDIAAYVLGKQKALRTALRNTQHDVQSQARRTPPAAPPASAPPTMLAQDVPSETFAKRAAPTELGTSMGQLSASFAKLGRTPPAPDAEQDARPAPDTAQQALLPDAAAPYVPPDNVSPRRVAFEDADMGTIEEEAEANESDDPVFAIDEDLAHAAAHPPAAPAVPPAQMPARRAPPVSDKLGSGTVLSFSALAESGMDAAGAYLRHVDQPGTTYARDQEGPYDLADRAPIPAAHRGLSSSRYGTRYSDDDATLASVLAGNTPSHRHLKHRVHAAYAPAVDMPPRGASQASEPVVARSVPPRHTQNAAHASTYDAQDNVDREPKTSVPYKESMLVPSLRKAQRAPNLPAHPPRVRASGFALPPERSVSPRQREPAPVPPVPFVPSARERVPPSPAAMPRTLRANVSEMGPELDKLLYYMHYVQNLKLSKRTGWYHHGVPAPESIADHMYRMAMLAMLVDPMGLDVHKCVLMALVHDLAEAQVGDLTPMCRVDKTEKTRREGAAMAYFVHDLLQDSEAAQRIHALWTEYEERATPEAWLVKDLDCFELCLQAYEYEYAHGTRDLQQFWQGAAPKIRHPQPASVEEKTRARCATAAAHMERGYLFGSSRERARAGMGRAHAVREAEHGAAKPARPRESSATASPYRTPIAAAQFYGHGASPSPVRSQTPARAARKRHGAESDSPRAKQSRLLDSDSEEEIRADAEAEVESSDAGHDRDDVRQTPAQTRTSMHTLDSSPDELDVLPSRPLHARMRRKHAPPAPATPTASAAPARTFTVPLHAMFIGEWYARDPRLKLVSFPAHFAIMLDTTLCAKIAMRDIFNWTIGGETHRLFVLVVKHASARTLRQLAPDPEVSDGRLQVYFCADTRTAAHQAPWDALLQRVRHTDVRRAHLLPEAGAASLYARLDASAQHAMRLPSPGALPDLLDAQATLDTPAADAADPSHAEPPAEYNTAPAHPTHTVVALDASPRSSPEPEERVRRSARHRAVDAASTPILRYPASGPFAVTILESDLHRLDEDEYLNDTIIEFGLRYFLEQVRQRDARLADQIHLFNSFFFYKMSEFRDRAKSYEQVRKWTNRVDIFAKKYLVLPINEHMHWYLAIVVNPGAILQPRDVSPMRRSLRNTPESSPNVSDAEGRSTPAPSPRAPRVPTKIVPGERRPPPPPPEPERAYVLVLDSLGSSHSAVKTVLRDYLRWEARDKQRVAADMDLKRLGDPVHVDVRVASQPNFCDCGLYLLHNFQCFFSDPHLYFDAALASRRSATHPDAVWRAGDMAQCRKDWQALLRQLSAAWHKGETAPDAAAAPPPAAPGP